MTQRGKLCFPTSPFDIQRLAVDITRRGGQAAKILFVGIRDSYDSRIPYFVLRISTSYLVHCTLYNSLKITKRPSKPSSSLFYLEALEGSPPLALGLSGHASVGPWHNRW